MQVRGIALILQKRIRVFRILEKPHLLSILLDSQVILKSNRQKPIPDHNRFHFLNRYEIREQKSGKFHGILQCLRRNGSCMPIGKVL